MNGYSNDSLRKAKVIYLHGQFLFQTKADTTHAINNEGSRPGINLSVNFQLPNSLSTMLNFSKTVGLKNQASDYVDDSTFQNIEINLAKKNERPLKNAISQIL